MHVVSLVRLASKISKKKKNYVPADKTYIITFLVPL